MTATVSAQAGSPYRPQCGLPSRVGRTFGSPNRGAGPRLFPIRQRKGNAKHVCGLLARRNFQSRRPFNWRGADALQQSLLRQERDEPSKRTHDTGELAARSRFWPPRIALAMLVLALLRSDGVCASGKMRIQEDFHGNRLDLTQWSVEAGRGARWRTAASRSRFPPGPPAARPSDFRGISKWRGILRSARVRRKLAADAEEGLGQRRNLHRGP